LRQQFDLKPGTDEDEESIREIARVQISSTGARTADASCNFATAMSNATRSPQSMTGTSTAVPSFAALVVVGPSGLSAKCGARG
jgi:hypothetical protein